MSFYVHRITHECVKGDATSDKDALLIHRVVYFDEGEYSFPTVELSLERLSDYMPVEDFEVLPEFKFMVLENNRYVYKPYLKESWDFFERL